jgi:hypothetical protein
MASFRFGAGWARFGITRPHMMELMTLPQLIHGQHKEAAMGIFQTISEVVLGQAATPVGTQADAQAAPASGQSAPWWSQAPAQNAADIEASLEQRAAAHGERLNWRTSIVDLMKLVGIDPSLDNRKALAAELGYTGDTGDSASMNIWLHRQVMRELAANGGRVPAELTD